MMVCLSLYRSTAIVSGAIMQWRPEEQEEIINSLADFISETPS